MAPVRPGPTASLPEPVSLHDGLAVYRIGEGPPVLLMPAPHRFQQPGDGTAASLVESLTAVGRQVISFDPPGVARSTRPADVSMDEILHCADEALMVCGMGDRIPVMGQSMAGLVALAYAIEHPAQVGSLVLSGTGTGGRAYMHAPGALWNRSHPQFPGMLARAFVQMTIRTRAPEAILNNYIDRHSYVDQARAPQVPVRLADWLRPRRGHPEWQRIAVRMDYGPRLHEICVPTLLLCGRLDPQFPPACSQELAHGIPGARLVWFQRSGHYPDTEEPNMFRTALADFLDNDAAGRR